jgi:hypothetical protein
MESLLLNPYASGLAIITTTMLLGGIIATWIRMGRR